MDQRKRLDYFDVAKGIGACLVVLGHLPEAVDIHFRTWIFSFHMPLFFIISGMLLSYKKDVDKNFLLLIKKRARTILIPYVSFSIIYMVAVLFAYFQNVITPKTILDNLWYVISLYGMNVLWFLPALFFGELIFLFIMKKFDSKTSKIVIVVSFTISYFASVYLNNKEYAAIGRELVGITYFGQLLVVFFRSFIAMSFIAIGYFLFFLLKERKRISIFELFLSIALLAINIVIGKKNGGVDMRSLDFKNVFLYYGAALSGTFSLLLFCKNCYPFHILKYFGKNSLTIMASHNSLTLLYVATTFAMYANQYITRAKDYLYAFNVFAVIMIYVVIVIEIINRFFPFIIGKEYNRKNGKKKTGIF